MEHPLNIQYDFSVSHKTIAVIKQELIPLIIRPDSSDDEWRQE